MHFERSQRSASVKIFQKVPELFSTIFRKPLSAIGLENRDGDTVAPAFQALIYPGRTQRIEPATNSPPVFLVCGYNDRPDISEGLATVYLKFKQLKVPAELHIYAGSGHGFGLRPKDPKPAGKWIERFEEWLADSGFLRRN